jgi:hypothetical protein
LSKVFNLISDKLRDKADSDVAILGNELGILDSDKSEELSWDGDSIGDNPVDYGYSDVSHEVDEANLGLYINFAEL